MEAHKLILGDVEYLKFKNCFINLKRIILRRVPSVNSTAIRLPFRGDKTFGTPTANGQGTMILSVCKNHPKCAAQGKTKRVNGTVPPVDGTRCNDGNLTAERIGNSQIYRDGTLQLNAS